jgi:hypothetical protein
MYFGCAQCPLVLQVLLVLRLCSVSLGFAFVAGGLAEFSDLLIFPLSSSCPFVIATKERKNLSDGSASANHYFKSFSFF